MHVAETRANSGGLRRRRHCMSPTCRGRITTQEVVVRVDHMSGNPRPFDGQHVVVPAVLWEQLKDAAREILGASAQIEYSDPALAKPGETGS